MGLITTDDVQQVSDDRMRIPYHVCNRSPDVMCGLLRAAGDARQLLDCSFLSTSGHTKGKREYCYHFDIHLPILGGEKTEKGGSELLAAAPKETDTRSCAKTVNRFVIKSVIILLVKVCLDMPLTVG